MNAVQQANAPDGRSPATGIAFRVASLFGALLVISIAALLAAWLYGLPPIGWQGANATKLEEARHALELSADSRVSQIENALRERRGDLRVISENEHLAQLLGALSERSRPATPDEQARIRRLFSSLLSAYPDAYEHIMLITADAGRVVAASDRTDVSHQMIDPELLQRTTLPGIIELIETTAGPSPAAERELLITRQVLERDQAGLPTGKLLGVLIASLSMKTILGEFDRAELRSLGDSGSVVLSDTQRRVLGSFQLRPVADQPRPEPPPAGHTMEGSFDELAADGREILATYRFIRVGASEGWNLLIRRDRGEALGELSQLAWRLLVFGLLFALLGLAVVGLAARVVTRPITDLADAARRLAAGELGARVALPEGARRDEIWSLGSAFNELANRVESWHATLASEVEARTRELLQEKNTAQRYLDVAGVMMVVLDRNGRIALINRKGCEVLGWSEQDLLGSDWFDRFIPEVARRETRQVFADLIEGKHELRARYENAIVNAAGEVRLIDWRNILLRDDDGEIQGVLSSGDDITERQQIEAQLKDQQQDLEALVVRRTAELTTALDAAKVADRAKDQFLANVSHELRTPLNAVIGLSRLALRLGRDPRQCDYLEKIADAGKTLAHLIDDLLDLSKIAAGRMEFESTTFSLRQLIQRSSSVMAYRAAEKGLDLAEQVDADVPDILVGDPLRLEQILLNLLSNAIKFTAEGRVDVGIGVHQIEAERVCLDITVDDSGVGIDEADLGLLFQPFSQADATMSRKFGGTGLGLAICRRLAEMMDGEISVSSRPCQGSRFRVRVWLGLGTAEDLPADDGGVGLAMPAAYRDARILVVEDQPLNREIVESLLADVGITPSVATNGQEALDRLTAAGPDAFDLVLMDIQMPVMDGLTATRELRSRSEFRSLPIIAMTAHTMEHEREISKAAGMSDHIGKPFEATQFYRLLAKWIPAARHQPAPDEVQSAPSRKAAGMPRIEGVNTTEALERFAGNIERYRYWLNQFAAESVSFVGELGTLLGDDSREAARQLVHAFKGRAGMLGIDDLHALAAQLEAAIRSGNSTGEAAAALASSIEHVRTAIQRALDEANTLPPAPDSTPVPGGPVPAPVLALLPLLEAADGGSAAALEACLDQLHGSPWAPRLRNALSRVRAFDFESARQELLEPATMPAETKP